MRNSLIKTILAAVVITSLAACGKTTDDDKKCGDQKTWKAHKETLSVISSELVGTTRKITYEDLSTPENICSDEHVNIHYEVIDTTLLTTKWTGYAYWSVYGETTPLGNTNKSSPLVYADANIGLKQAFPNGGGYIGLQLIAEFPTYGSDSLDRLYCYQDLYYGNITLEYYPDKK